MHPLSKLPSKSQKCQEIQKIIAIVNFPKQPTNQIVSVKK
jgi:hypothetical protein